MKKKVAPLQRLHHFVSIGRDASRIEVQLVAWGDGVPRLDVRRYVSTGKYSGPTRSGLSLTAGECATLLGFREEILNKLTELWRERPWDELTGDDAGTSLRSSEE